MILNLMSKGFTTLELCITLLLSGVILTATTTIFRHSAHNTVHLRKAYQVTATDIRATSAIQQVLSDYDSHRLKIPIPMHQRGHIKFSDGSAHPITKTNTNTSPNPSSDAITGLALNLKLAQRVLSTKRYNNSLQYYVCPRFDDRLPLNYSRSFIGLNIDGAFELSGTTHRHLGRGECRDLNLQPGLSMTTPSIDLAGASLMQLIIPVTRHYTYYVDRLGRLRYMSHAGSNTVENQPVATNLNRLKLESFTILNSDIRGLKGTLYFDPQGQKTFSFVQQLSRLPHWNLLLNRP